jgi:hypothetical protein
MHVTQLYRDIILTGIYRQSPLNVQDLPTDRLAHKSDKEETSGIYVSSVTRGIPLDNHVFMYDIYAKRSAYKKWDTYFVNWYRHDVSAEETDSIFVLFGDETCFNLKWHAKCHTSGSWSAVNPMLIYNGLLHDVSNGVWCVISTTRVTQPIHFPTSSLHTDVLNTFWRHFEQMVHDIKWAPGNKNHQPVHSSFRYIIN